VTTASQTSNFKS